MQHRIVEEQWTDAEKTDDLQLARALQENPELVSQVVTFAFGQSDERFPLSFLTEGLGRTENIEGTLYDYRIQGKMNRAYALAADYDTTAGSTPGIGYSTFTLKFESKCFPRDYVVFTQSGYQIRVHSEPEFDGTFYNYTFSYPTDNPSNYIPTSELAANNLFSKGFAPVASAWSTGNDSNYAMPGQIRGQITTIRKSYGYGGNLQNKTMSVYIQTKSQGTLKYWLDYMEYQYMLQWAEESESQYWYAKDNRDINGQVNLKDDNGYPIPIGDGVQNQISNQDTFGILTEKKMKQAIRNITFGMADGANRVIDLHTGTGGCDDFDTAMKAALRDNTYVKLTDNKFVSGDSPNLAYGGYFSSYRHIDGHVINVIRNAMFDSGPQALASRLHPISGLPIESHKMVMLDKSTYQGESNLMMVTQKGREMLRWCVAGAMTPKGFTGNDSRASALDGSYIHLMKAGQPVLRRFNTSLVLTCDLS